MSTLLDWIRSHGALMAWLGILSVGMFVAGLLLVPWIAVRLPADYFVRPAPPPGSLPRRHPLLHLLFHLGKNLLGLVLVLAGIAMLVLPGQGILTILMGLGLLDFPGKRAAERWIVQRPPIRRSIDALRRRAGRPPLVLEPPAKEGSP